MGKQMEYKNIKQNDCFQYTFHFHIEANYKSPDKVKEAERIEKGERQKPKKMLSAHQLTVPPLSPPLFFSLSWTDKLTKASTSARDRRVLQHLALNVHVKHSDLT